MRYEEIPFRCPRCSAVVMARIISAGIPHREEEFFIMPAILYCPACLKSFFAELPVKAKDPNEALKNFAMGIKSIDVLKARAYPSPEYYRSNAVPQEIMDLFFDIQARSKHPAMIIAGCRSVLEASVDRMNAKGNTLFEKIEYLFKEGIIPKPIAEWCHIIRKFGNKAVHEIQATREEAEEIVELTRFFLIYVFELPAKVAEIRKRFLSAH